MPRVTGATGHALSDKAPRRAGDPRWRDLGVRAASGIVLAGIALAAMWAGGAVWFVCIAILGALMAAEWIGLARARGAATLLAGLCYIAPSVPALIWLRAQPHGLRWMLVLAAVVWGGDIGAYLVGRLVGGPRLAPRISPGKTWSGAIGGTAVAVLGGLALWPDRLGWAVPVCLLLSVAAQAGDLLESAMKRWFGVKDSGRLIPGHGGVLDRLDGVLAAAPLAVVLLVARQAVLF